MEEKNQHHDLNDVSKQSLKEEFGIELGDFNAAKTYELLEQTKSKKNNKGCE
jgi:hypothetical protein